MSTHYLSSWTSLLRRNYSLSWKYLANYFSTFMRCSMNVFFLYICAINTVTRSALHRGTGNQTHSTCCLTFPRSNFCIVLCARRCEFILCKDKDTKNGFILKFSWLLKFYAFPQEYKIYFSPVSDTIDIVSWKNHLKSRKELWDAESRKRGVKNIIIL